MDFTLVANVLRLPGVRRIKKCGKTETESCKISLGEKLLSSEIGIPIWANK